MNTTETVPAVQPKLPPVPQAIARYVEEYKGMSVDDLIGVLENCARLTMEQMLRAAGAIYVASSLGHDLRPMLVGAMKSAGLVAFGQLTPEAAVAFTARRAVLAKVQQLPLQEQARVVQEGVRLAICTGDGVDEKIVPAKELTLEVALQVFDGDRVLTVAEQAAKINKDVVQKPRMPWLPPSVVIDRRHNQATIGGVVLSAGQISAILVELSKRH